MLARSTLQKAIYTVTKAVEEDHGLNYEEALMLYEQGVAHFLQVLNDESEDETSKETIQQKCIQYLDRADAIRNAIAAAKRKAVKIRESKSNGDGDPKMKILEVEGEIVIDPASVRFSDVMGLEAAKEALNAAIILPLKFPHLFTGNRKPYKSILLYGLSGTGKSHLSKAVATEAKRFSEKAKFFLASDLVLKWVGEMDKLVGNLLDLAKIHKPCIIFVDNVNVLSAASSGDEFENSRRAKILELLVKLQQVDCEGIVVLGTTNVPWVLDSVILKCFEKRVYAPLPDNSTRISMFKANLLYTPHMLAEVDFNQLAVKTDGRVRGPSRNEPGMIVDDLLTPCVSDAPGAIEMSWADVPGDKLFEPPITMSDMLKSLVTSKQPPKNIEDVKKMMKFKVNFGQEG